MVEDSSAIFGKIGPNRNPVNARALPDDEWSSSPTPDRDRLAGLDLARALALIGMLMVHLGPVKAEGLAGRLYALPEGRAALLFVLVAGVGVSLLAGDRRRNPAVPLLWRALLLLPLGLALQALAHTPVVILPLYALLFLLATGLIRLSGQLLLTICSALALAGPAGFLFGYLQAPAIFAPEPLAVRAAPGTLLHGLTLSGPQPLITWSLPFLVGLWLGRQDLRDSVVQFTLVSIGGLVALFLAAAGLVARALLGDALEPPGWLWLLRPDAHSQMPLWLWGGTASAAAMLGGSLWLAERAGRLLAPLYATGRIALTFYVAHVLALALWPQMLRSQDPLQAGALTLALTTSASLAAMIWLRRFRRGPLEVLMQPPRSPQGQAPATNMAKST